MARQRRCGPGDEKLALRPAAMGSGVMGTHRNDARVSLEHVDGVSRGSIAVNAAENGSGDGARSRGAPQCGRAQRTPLIIVRIQ